jgi:hypothetical protein
MQRSYVTSRVFMAVGLAIAFALAAATPSATAQDTDKGSTVIHMVWGITCSPGTTDCAVAGSENAQPMVDATDGSTWTKTILSAAPDFASLQDIDCPAITTCVAVGNVGSDVSSPSEVVRHLVETWDGAAWQEITPPPLPTGTALQSIACSTPTLCQIRAFGPKYFVDQLTLGGASPVWQRLVSMRTGARADVSDIQCRTSSQCLAVGSFNDKRSGIEARAWAWNGSTWTRQKVEVPKGRMGEWHLASISCFGAVCRAAGDFNLFRRDVHSLVEVSRHGHPFKIQATPDDRKHFENTLSRIHCTSTTYCLAIGTRNYNYIRGGPNRPLMLTWNGTRWRRVTLAANIDPTTFKGSGSDITCPTSNVCWSLATTFKSRGDNVFRAIKTTGNTVTQVDRLAF